MLLSNNIIIYYLPLYYWVVRIFKYVLSTIFHQTYALNICSVCVYILIFLMALFVVLRSFFFFNRVQFIFLFLSYICGVISNQVQTNLGQMYAYIFV